MTSAFLDKITYEAATMKTFIGIINDNRVYKYMCAPSVHVTEHEVILIDEAKSPLDAWSAQLDIIHDASYVDAWM